MGEGSCQLQLVQLTWYIKKHREIWGGGLPKEKEKAAFCFQKMGFISKDKLTFSKDLAKENETHQLSFSTISQIS